MFRKNRNATVMENEEPVFRSEPGGVLSRFRGELPCNFGDLRRTAEHWQAGKASVRRG